MQERFLANPLVTQIYLMDMYIKILQKKIADEIANDPDCTIIGIDDGWESGKSNLVGMIEKNSHQKMYVYPTKREVILSLRMMLGDTKTISLIVQF